MNNQELCKIYRQAIKRYGVEAQTKMAVEEMAELTNALMKLSRGRVSDVAVIEEIADVVIMSTQLAIIFGEKQVLKEIDLKTERLRQRLNAEKKQ